MHLFVAETIRVATFVEWVVKHEFAPSDVVFLKGPSLSPLPSYLLLHPPNRLLSSPID